MIITTTEQLSEFCASLAGAAFVTVDTEFMRERTYWSRLCLVQLGGPDRAVAVDPLAEGIDLAPLYALMADTRILKVFHAARQDVEIFFHATGAIPTPMFDTQIAAMVCGFGEAASYETLATTLANAKIDKSSRFTDWAQRPLTEKQIEYALGDVTHLRIVYEKLNAKLEKTGRADWVREELAILTNPATYRVEPREVWMKLRLRGAKPRMQAALREIAAWRELEAQRLNVPRGRVLKDEMLLEIASHTPRSAQELSRVRGLHAGFSESRQGTEILAALAHASALPAADLPAMEPKRAMPNGAAAVLDLLKVLLKQVSEEHDVAPRLIATNDDLEALAAEDKPEVACLSGWRQTLFGTLALSLKRGELALAVKDRRVVVSAVKN